MECDIHIVLEKKISDKWIGLWATDSMPYGYRLPVRRRCYNLFDDLAGVRPEGEPKAEPKGIPDDVSDLTKYSIEEIKGDGHSYSYLDAREFLRVFDEAMKESWFLKLEHREDYLIDPEWCLLGIDEDENLEDYRVIFYFDN